MPIVYNKLLKLLNENGITSYTIKKDKIIGQATFKKIKEGGDIDTRSISKLCELLNCQPGDILEYVPEDMKTTERKSTTETKTTLNNAPLVTATALEEDEEPLVMPWEEE